MELGAAVVVGESEGDGASVEDVALSEGEGASAGDVALSEGDGAFAGDVALSESDGASAGDGELSTGDGLLPDGEGASAGDGLSPAGVGLPAAAHTLSAVVEPAPLSTSVVALHVVQFVHAFWLVAVENVPVVHVTQVRSELLVPLEAIF